MNSIVPDKVLDQMICSECSKYLSVLPVHVYPNRDTKCGRCMEENDNGAPSQVNKVIPTMLFKCYNRYEGCSSLLLPDQVEEHEMNCISKSFHTCPLCSEANMPPYMMLAHFKKYHRCFLLARPIVQINATIDSEKHYLYCTENMIFLWNILVDTVNSKVFLNNKLVGPEELAKQISQQFCVKESFINGGHKIICELIVRFDVVQFSKFEVKKKDKLSINNNELYLSSTIKNLYPGCKLSPCRSFCRKQQLYSEEYFEYTKCSKPTVVCCSFCKDHVSQICSKGHILSVCIRVCLTEYLHLRAFCKWKCKKHFNGLDLYEHEQNCVYREPIPMCPVTNCAMENFKKFSELESHFKTHKNTILIPYWDSTDWF
ncbi:unnamed protein product [Brassicogethes aeneus]|uniref:Uncharacterized protein n=1 Tax=Brassicogethes aeneus TaxID=1431903 RepID=A0A9P0AQC5_BRAAE|nr:unnamed protein product [Brassicogethes aeneus]